MVSSTKTVVLSSALPQLLGSKKPLKKAWRLSQRTCLHLTSMEMTIQGKRYYSFSAVLYHHMHDFAADRLANIQCLQFAIRPTIRNNKDFKRDDVIKTVAAAVGPGHKVDLHGYDLLIFVEIYKVQPLPSDMHNNYTRR